ncbi:MAG: O-antigen ligase family protein [Terrimicrobiaceae bacterium]|nr:O-antigen ligase family protein [Terrimicrobiaceae bacterium]
MSILAAILTAFAIIAAQVLHGGLMVPFFSVPSDTLLVVATLPALIAACRNPAPSAPGALAAVAVLIGYVAWRCLHAPDQFLGRVELGQALSAGLAFLIGYGGLTNTRARFVFLGIVGAVAFGQAVVGFVQFAHGGLAAPLGWFSPDLRAIYETRFVTRGHGLFLNPNQFAWLMTWAALFSVSLACWARVNVIARVVLVYLALVFIVADILSGSRGGMAGLLGGLGVFCLAGFVVVTTMLRRGRALILLGGALVVALCVGVGAFAYSSNWVVQGRVDALQLGDIRSFLFEHARRQFEAAPLLGMGPGSFLYAARLYRTGNQANDAVFAHDDWLQTLVEYGFVGFALAILTALVLLGGGVQRFFSALRRLALTNDRPLSNSAAILAGAFSATAAFCIHSFTDFNMHVPANALLAGATLGLLAGTPGEPAGARRMQGGILRVFTAVAMVCMAAGLGLYTWQHGVSDTQSLRAQNSLHDGDIRATLAATEAGLKWEPNHAALLATLGRAWYAYESSLQFEGEAKNGKAGSDESQEAAIVELTPEQRRKVYQSSADAFTKALKLQPMERSYEVELARALDEVGEPQQAKAHLIDVIRLDPAHAYAYASYADHIYEKGDLPAALHMYFIACQVPGSDYAISQVQSLQEEMNPPSADENADSGADGGDAPDAEKKGDKE